MRCRSTGGVIGACYRVPLMAETRVRKAARLLAQSQLAYFPTFAKINRLERTPCL